MINKIIKIAQQELGYKEGKNNNTKYGQAYGLNNNPWCMMFIWWIANQAGIGTDIIPKTASCPTAFRWFRDKGQIVHDIKVGDIVFFTWNGSNNADHVGIVESVDNTHFVTIEGNKNDAVERRAVSRTTNTIFAIARPSYTNLNQSTPTTQRMTTNTYTYTQFIKDVQSCIGAKIDGIAGPETLSKTITISRYKNSRHTVVMPLQKYLNALGYNCGQVDGIAGKLFDSAVKSFQKANSCVCDGEITARNKTWKKLFKLA